MTSDGIITLAGTIVTVLLAALHTGGRISTIETKVDLLMRGMIKVSNTQDAENHR